jgi:hypothetical protein
MTNYKELILLKSLALLQFFEFIFHYILVKCK